MTAEFRNDSNIWKASCLQLLETLTVIERGILKSNDSEIYSATLSAMMIAGFAFENAFKSWYLKVKGDLYNEEGKQKGFSSHAYTTWVEQNKLQLLGREGEALDKAQFFCLAWGRYPAHNKKDKERPYETCGLEDVKQLKNLIGRLLDGTITYKK